MQYMQDLASKEQQAVEERTFTLDCSSVQVSAALRNPVDAWEVTPLDDGLVSHHHTQYSVPPHNKGINFTLYLNPSLFL